MNNLKLLSGSLRVGIGGPVGTGKTALVDKLCKSMRDDYNIATITNDIYTREDAEFLTRSGALEPERIVGVETGGCPHTAIREDASMNLAAVAELNTKFPGLSLILLKVVAIIWQQLFHRNLLILQFMLSMFLPGIKSLVKVVLALPVLTYLL